MRTDRTTLCARCAVRFPAAERCPRCERGDQVYDLRRARARRRALQALRGRPAPGESATEVGLAERLATGYVKYGLAALTLAGAVAGWQLGGSMLAGFVVGLAALWGAVALFFVAAGAFYLLMLAGRLLVGMFLLTLRMLRGRRSLPRVLPVDDQELLPDVGIVELRGRVHLDTPLQSMLAHRPCAAFRVAGEGPVGEVDDAGGTHFEVIDPDGERIEVRADVASIALEVEASPQALQPDARLKQFLEDRGVYPERGPVRLAEAILSEGDEVVVTGACDHVLRSHGYREARQVRVLREKPGAPLVVRKP